MSLASLRTVLDESPIGVRPSIAVTATVSAAVALMKERNVDALMAMDDDRFAGLFTVQHVLSSLTGSSRDAGATRVVDALSEAAPSVDVNTSIDQTLYMMDEYRCQHVAVSSGGRVLGVLSRKDLTDWIIRNQQEQLDCAIRAVKQMGYSNRRP